MLNKVCDTAVPYSYSAYKRNQSMTTSLNQARLKIDELDDQILKILTQRAEVIEDITKAKSQQGNINKADIFDPFREDQIINRMRSSNKSKLPEKAITAIFKTIIQSCRNLQYSNLTKAAPTKNNQRQAINEPLA